MTQHTDQAQADGRVPLEDWRVDRAYHESGLQPRARSSSRSTTAVQATT